VRIVLNAAGDILMDGANLVEAGNHAGLTAMHYATYLDHQEVMKVLLSFRANVSAQAEYFDLDWPSVNAGDTPMHVAASKGNVEAIRILLKGYVSNLEVGVLGWCKLFYGRDMRAEWSIYNREGVFNIRFTFLASSKEVKDLDKSLSLATVVEEDMPFRSIFESQLCGLGICLVFAVLNHWCLLLTDS
jgi:hypothetical protein